jgi:hypothetical protein
MPKFYVQTFVRIYLSGIEVEADSYHEAAVKAERCIRRDYVEDKGEEGNLITGQYTQMIERPRFTLEIGRAMRKTLDFSSWRPGGSTTILLSLTRTLILAPRAATFTQPSLLRTRGARPPQKPMVPNEDR